MNQNRGCTQSVFQCFRCSLRFGSPWNRNFGVVCRFWIRRIVSPLSSEMKSAAPSPHGTFTPWHLQLPPVNPLLHHPLLHAAPSTPLPCGLCVAPSTLSTGCGPHPPRRQNTQRLHPPPPRGLSTRPNPAGCARHPQLPPLPVIHPSSASYIQYHHRRAKLGTFKPSSAGCARHTQHTPLQLPSTPTPSTSRNVEQVVGGECPLVEDVSGMQGIGPE